MSQQQTTDTDESTQALFHVSATVSYAYVFISSFELWTLESAHLWSLQIFFGSNFSINRQSQSGRNKCQSGNYLFIIIYSENNRSFPQVYRLFLELSVLSMSYFCA